MSTIYRAMSTPLQKRRASATHGHRRNDCLLSAALPSDAIAIHDEAPLSCPPGATLMGAPPPKADEVWCQKIIDGKPVKDGIFVAYGGATDRMIQGYYRDGVQEGEWTTWYENGQRSAVDHYRNGAAGRTAHELVRQRRQGARRQVSQREA